jgi:chromate transporter
VLWQLFYNFLIIGFIAFGGGYAMIPVIGAQVDKFHWMTAQEYMDVTAIAGMAPGPIATNTAILVGYKTAGFTGALVSAAGMVLPSLILVVAVATVFYKLYQHKLTKAAFYGLRPVVVGLIFYGAIKFSVSSGMISPRFTASTVTMWCIFAASLLLLWRAKLHPFYVIILSGLVGVALYS